MRDGVWGFSAARTSSLIPQASSLVPQTNVSIPNDRYLPSPEGTERLALLNEISRVLSSTLDLPALYRLIYEQIGRVMDTSEFYLALCIGQPGAAPQRISVPIRFDDGRLMLDDDVESSNDLTSYAINHRVTVLFHTSEERRTWERRHGMEKGPVDERVEESGIFVPLTIGNRTIGLIGVQSQRPHAYGREDVQALSVIAGQAAVAIENARLYAESRQSVQRMQTLLEVARTVRSSLSLPVVLDSILTSVREVMPYYLAEIFLPDLDRGHFEIAGSAGYRAEERRTTIRIPLGKGLIGRVYTTGEPLIVADVRLAPEYFDTGVEQAHSLLMVPLRQGDGTIGVLNVEREEIDSFNEEDLQVLSLFASQAAIAIENARLFSEQQQRVSELQTIQSIVQQLTPLHDVFAIAELFDRELGRLIAFDACRLFVLDHQEGLIVPLTGGHHEFRLRIGEGITGWIAEHGEAVLIDDTLTDERSRQIPGTPVRSESVIGAPMIYEGRVRGVITLSKTGIGRFDHNELRLLRIIAAQGALAFDRARLYEQLRNDAITDPLTGLYNRRALHERLAEEYSRAIRNEHPLVVIMMDIDKFKRVNDSRGHKAGDLVLAELARIIRHVVRAEDVVARFGGEEFCLILPEIPPGDAARVAERLRGKVAEHRLPPGSGVEQVTVSLGIAAFEHEESAPELLARADQAMYHAKKAGGNCSAVLERGHFRTIPRVL